MNDSLREELKGLLLKYPELQHTVVDFSVLSANGTQTNSSIAGFDQEAYVKPAVPVCDVVESGRPVIRGHSQKVEIRRSKVHGYGVFAKDTIEEGELIEELRLLKLGWRENYCNDPVLSDYVLANKSCNCSECAKHGSVLYLLLGFGSIYNHSDFPNTIQSRDFKKGVMQVRASRRIEKDGEVFVTYGSKYFLVRDFMKTVEQNKTLEKCLENRKKSEQ